MDDPIRRLAMVVAVEAFLFAVGAGLNIAFDELAAPIWFGVAGVSFAMLVGLALPDIRRWRDPLESAKRRHRKKQQAKERAQRKPIREHLKYMNHDGIFGPAAYNEKTRTLSAALVIPRAYRARHSLVRLIVWLYGWAPVPWLLRPTTTRFVEWASWRLGARQVTREPLSR